MPLILTSPFYSERWEKGVEQELAEKQRKEERKGRGGKRGKEGRKGGKNSSPGRLSLNLKVKSISGICLFCSPSTARSQPGWREWPNLFLFSLPRFFFFFPLVLRATYISNLSLYKRELERLCISSWSEDWTTLCQGSGPLKVRAFRYSNAAERQQWFRLSQLGDCKCQQQGLLFSR